MPETMVNIRIVDSENCSNIDFQINNGISHKTGNCEYILTFYKSIGGKSYFLGKEIKNSSPAIINTVLILESNVVIKEINYSIIIKLKSEIKGDSKIYLLNL